MSSSKTVMKTSLNFESFNEQSTVHEWWTSSLHVYTLEFQDHSLAYFYSYSISPWQWQCIRKIILWKLRKTLCVTKLILNWDP